MRNFFSVLATPLLYHIGNIVLNFLLIWSFVFVVALAYQPVKPPSSQKRSGGKGPASYFPQQTLGNVFHSNRDPPATIEARITSPTGAPGGIIGQFQGQSAYNRSGHVTQGQSQNQDKVNAPSVISSNVDVKSFPSSSNSQSQNVPRSQLSHHKPTQPQNTLSDVSDISQDLQTLSIDSRSHENVQESGAFHHAVTTKSESPGSLVTQGTSDHRTTVNYGYQPAESSAGTQVAAQNHHLGYQQPDRRPNSTYSAGQEGRYS